MGCQNNMYYFMKRNSYYEVQVKTRGLTLVRDYCTNRFEYINITKNIKLLTFSEFEKVYPKADVLKKLHMSVNKYREKA